ncbi:conserved hypothetical protein [Candidatus Carsonella ruddii PV]|uniref:MFS transporter n=1 Tax=Carsonella ruddii (strain PV) TaxID=387662 RepID=Q05FW0_CARRP|nr:hypothetical protein [Candidatus Carsonella ruddii]BAF35061.1 conserved hypothetical protein [Candidatus Carsonella ruddii PV]
MNKNIFIILPLIFNIYFYNNVINSNLVLKFSNKHTKNFINFKIMFCHYIGNMTGSYFFSKRVNVNLVPISLYLFLFFLNTVFFLVKCSYNLYFCLFCKIFIGFLISSINNTSDFYVSKYNKKISNFYNSIIYFSSFIAQNILNLYKINFLNSDNLYIFLFLITHLNNKLLLIIDDIDIKNKKKIKFKNLEKPNFYIMIVFMFIISFISILNNYINNMFKKSITNELSTFTNFTSLGGALSFYIITFFNDKDKKKLLILFLSLLLTLSSLITYFLNYKIIKCYILFLIGLFTYPIYFVSCSVLKKRFSKKNNIFYSIANSISYAISPFFSIVYNKNNIFIFFTYIKIITILYLILLILCIKKYEF